jgi:hypothetical protein
VIQPKQDVTAPISQSEWRIPDTVTISGSKRGWCNRNKMSGYRHRLDCSLLSVGFQSEKQRQCALSSVDRVLGGVFGVVYCSQCRPLSRIAPAAVNARGHGSHC